VLTLVQYLTPLAAALWHTASCSCFVVFRWSTQLNGENSCFW